MSICYCYRTLIIRELALEALYVKATGMKPRFPISPFCAFVSKVLRIGAGSFCTNPAAMCEQYGKCAIKYAQLRA